MDGNKNYESISFWSTHLDMVERFTHFGLNPVGRIKKGGCLSSPPSAEINGLSIDYIQ